MGSVRRGKSTSAVEVTHISAAGVWVLLDGRELFLPFRAFPWFRSATIAQILRVERHSARHLYWPDLDVDLSVDSIEHPDRFPLVSRERPGSAAATGKAEDCANASAPARVARGAREAPKPRASRTR